MNLTTRHKNSGIVLAGVLVILVSLTLVALTVAQRNTMDEMMAANQRDGANALTIAESGIEAGFALVKNNYVHNQEMKDELLQLPNNILSQGSVSGGNYLVTVIDGVADDGVVTLNSLGDFNGGVREIEIVMGMLHPGKAAYAILTNADIDGLSGSAQVNGPNADIHSNSDVYVGNLNSPGIAGTVSASGTITAQDPTDIAGGTVSGAAQVEIPHVYPPDYLPYAMVIFTADCKVMSPSGVLWADIGNNGIWHGWRCNPGDNWSMGSNNPADGFFDGFYYVHGNVVINGGPDTDWPVTIVAEGNIEITGNPIFVPWGSVPPNDTGDAEANDILFLAGNDIDMRGTAGATTSGIIAAHMEIAMSGNITHTGTVLAENGLHGMGQEVTTGQAFTDIVSTNDFTGNVVINGTGSGLGAIKKLAVTAWRELVH